MGLDPAGLTCPEILAECRELGADGPRLARGKLELVEADAQAVLGSARRARLTSSALRKAVAQIPGEPVRFKAAELRTAIRTFRARLAHIEPEVARLKAAGQDRGGPQAEFAATTIALARLEADLAALNKSVRK